MQTMTGHYVVRRREVRSNPRNTPKYIRIVRLLSSHTSQAFCVRTELVAERLHPGNSLVVFGWFVRCVFGWFVRCFVGSAFLL